MAIRGGKAVRLAVRSCRLIGRFSGASGKSAKSSRVRRMRRRTVNPTLVLFLRL